MPEVRYAIAHRIPVEVTPLPQWLGDIAAQCALVTTQDCAPGYGDKFGQIVVVDDYTNGDEVVFALESLVKKGAKHLISGTEDDVLRVARLRDRYDLPGLRENDALHFIDKHIMKSVARTAVTVPAFAALDDRAAMRTFRSSNPGPYVLKPRRGYGSRGVRVVTNLAELDEASAGLNPEEHMVEEFISGEMFHVDGFMRDGQLLLAIPSAYLNTCLAFQESAPLGSIQLDTHSPVAMALSDFAGRVIKALPDTDLCPFHLEVFRREDGEFVFCEIAARLGGGHIMETFTHRIGINPVHLWYREQACCDDARYFDAIFSRQQPMDAGSTQDCAGFLLVPPQVGTLLTIDEPPLPDYVQELTVNTTFPREFEGATASTDEILGFVVTGADSHDVELKLRECITLAQSITHWAC